ncbi:MAG: hypothetical protein K1X57_04470 [Gemmataceae bacterium]|nr:hypothetical protein [Gemmataceae bacterium]
MSFWLRELIGWFLVALGLAVFFLVIVHLVNGRVYPTAGMTVIGIFVFRGGIHLLKVALAARVCAEAAERLRAPVTLPARRGRTVA